MYPKEPQIPQASSAARYGLQCQKPHHTSAGDETQMVQPPIVKLLQRYNHRITFTRYEFGQWYLLGHQFLGIDDTHNSKHY